MLENDIVKIKKAEANAASLIVEEEKGSEAHQAKTRKLLEKKMIADIGKNHQVFLSTDSKLRKDIDARSSTIIKEGKKEVVLLREKVEKSVKQTGKSVFEVVLDTLENE
ncbi:MAG: hypothetical protein QF682_08475 [Candidatus Thermoplasmatota archaeon]|jgi:hypothetical protein|nr:hypothetical protein [Candidatus Thermoplasmatota archaeon]